ncbi:MAG: hypothetical protein Q9213_004398 [Squamulea squamosa]
MRGCFRNQYGRCSFRQFVNVILSDGTAFRRRFYTPAIVPPDEVKVNIKVGSSGLIPLRIRSSPKPSPNAPIIIYLRHGCPPKGYYQRTYNPLNTLSLSAQATVVEIGYRLSGNEPYPKPIHDVIAGYDWIRKHLSSSPVIVNHNGLPNSKYIYSPPQTFAGLGVCGELAGGSLAAMLALTECKTNGITAAALGDPIVDWSSPLRLPTSSSSDVDSPNRSLKNLHTTCFAKSEHRYDPFASPLLFFRTPAYELPTPSLYGSSFSPGPKEESSDSDGASMLVPRRRSHRKHPPLGSGLRLPMTRIDVRTDFALKDQVLEFAELLQRGVNLYEDKSAIPRERVEVVEREGEGLWSEKDFMQIGSWMGEMLRRD